METKSENPSSVRKKKALPVWSKVVIVLVITLFAGSIYGVIQGTLVFYETFRNVEDPIHIKKVAASIAEFPDPLPEGYSYVLGVSLDVLGDEFKALGIDFKKGKQTIVLYCLSVDKGVTAAEMLKRFYKVKLVNTISFVGSFVESTGQGSWTLPNGQMPYVVGKVKRSSDESMHTGLIACMVLPDSKRAILMYVVEPGAKEKFDMDVTMKLLTHIGRFK